ncbi:FAD/NAD-binding domain-containing protein [Fomitiporia mediterranea MF3/22]|uniref:FAD/NAD-binding domain-containing protein n=1 Tax=Fomitiporia mediterranea (strain MF3/22) TaxID=694068 RepID=UPI0004408DEA|nr:FAD/NAD-binding domain-containing protein [Fomitiporia mediterranea MF3/22]EJC97898.1 FAD/NAD-binding domain-containing protein [Fomitiporia mediterranea MF3/22]
METYDCIVVGSGHAGSCAALSAAQSGCKRVLIVEKAPREWTGGNGFFTAGGHRTTHEGVKDLLPIVQNVSAEQAYLIDMDPYRAEDFTRDIMRLSGERSDKALVEELVKNSRDTVEWLARSIGVRFILAFNRQAYQVGGRQKFWGGLVLSVVDGGKGLIADDHAALQRAGIEIKYDTCATALLKDGDSICGLVATCKGADITFHSSSVVLACGGFEANRTLRSKHLGDEWSRARVRGTPFNTGDGLTLASAVGAKLTGDFSGGGCHSTCWDANADPDAGNRVLSNQYTKSGYPLGLMINAAGRRFVDEGADYRNYTYAAYGRAILAQPGGIAFQVYDNQVIKWLREEEYADDVVKKVYADSIDDLADKLVAEGLEGPTTFVSTIEKYNEAVHTHRGLHSDLVWDPSVKDGLSTGVQSTVDPPKSNWALPLTRPPFLAVKIACGITFTFGGLAIDPESAGVISEDTGKPIPGLFCAGELVGGLFYGNYPGGSGLTSGAVFGKKAGNAAAYHSRQMN